MQLTEKAQEVIGQVNQVILGKEKEVREVMLAFLANGHVLLEDIPGRWILRSVRAVSEGVG